MNCSIEFSMKKNGEIDPRKSVVTFAPDVGDRSYLKTTKRKSSLLPHDRRRQSTMSEKSEDEAPPQSIISRRKTVYRPGANERRKAIFLPEAHKRYNDELLKRRNTMFVPTTREETMELITPHRRKSMISMPLDTGTSSRKPSWRGDDDDNVEDYVIDWENWNLGDNFKIEIKKVLESLMI